MLKTMLFRVITMFLVWGLATNMQNAHAETNIQAITNPSADVTLSFVQTGRIIEVFCRDGQAVKADEPLVRQDDAVAQLRLEQLKAQSENTSQVEASQVSLEQKRVDLEKFERAAERGAATPLEAEHARLEVKMAELSLEIAKLEHAQNKLRYLEEKKRVDNMTLRSPISGQVERVDVEVGETVDSSIDAVRIVRIDPLWIDVHAPIEKARTVKVGETAYVRFPDGTDEPVPGTVTFVAAVADAASNTLRIRIEVPNSSNRPAGEHVIVVLGEQPGSSQAEES